MKNEYLTLYHATNENSLNLMRQTGYIGLDQEDYKLLSKEVSTILSCEEKIFYDLIDKDSGESNGGVSFFPILSSCERILKYYAKHGGEWRGVFIRQAFKRYARKNKISYKSLEEKMNNLIGSDSMPVILEFSIPKTYVVNTDSIGTNEEHYTEKKVSMNYLVKVHYCR